MNARFPVAAATLLITAALSVASQAPLPLVNAETIKGSWEALSEDNERVFRLELGQGAGWLSVGLEFIDPMTFALTSAVWRDGAVDLYFTGVGRSSTGAAGPDDPTPYTAVLRLSGVAWTDDGTSGGLLTGVFVLRPEQKPENLWKVRFLKHSALPDCDKLSQLLQRAKEAIERQKQNPK